MAGGPSDQLSATQNGVAAINNLYSILRNVWPPVYSGTSPQVTGLNSLSTTAVVAVSPNTTRHGILFHNPGSINTYVYPSNIGTAPSVASPGGSFVIYGGGTLSFPSPLFSNVNCGWSAFVSSGSNQPLTILEFY